MSKLFLILLTLPLLAIAEEVVLDLSYNPPIDFNYCKNNPPECGPIPSIIPKFELVEQTTSKQWALFFTFQVLDVYSTSKAIKYDCITEINPLFTETPGDLRLVATKTLLLAPALIYNDGYAKVTPDELDNSNMLYMFVVANNFRLLNEAKRNCNKIR